MRELAVLVIVLCLAGWPVVHVSCQNSLALENSTRYFFSNQTCRQDNGCGAQPPDLAPNDDVCVVRGVSLEVNCNCVGNSTLPPQPELPCPGCPNGTAPHGRLNFTTIQEALTFCPYDTLVLEVTGTHYVGSLLFPEKRAVWMRGYLTRITISNCSTIPISAIGGGPNAAPTPPPIRNAGRGGGVAGQTRKGPPTFADLGLNASLASNFLYVLNLTYSRVPIFGPPAVIVGSNHSVLNPNTSLTFENITHEGCNTPLPLFAYCPFENITEVNTTGVCDLPTPPIPPPPPPPPPKPVTCIIDHVADTLTDCESNLNFDLNCTRLIRPAGPCLRQGVITTCPARNTSRWNCTDPVSLAMGVRYSCLLDRFLKRLYDCRWVCENSRALCDGTEKKVFDILSGTYRPPPKLTTRRTPRVVCSATSPSSLPNRRSSRSASPSRGRSSWRTCVVGVCSTII